MPNTLAAIMLEVARQTAEPPHIYFAWSERGPGENALLFLIGGGGDIPPLTHEILRVAEPDAAKRPLVHVGGRSLHRLTAARRLGKPDAVTFT